ncbi:hypothetical protein, partial [Aeromonas allosaccharophila]
MSKPSLFDMLDQVRPDLEPLAPHFMTDKELVEKERYLTLLAANLLEEGGLTEPQARLFEMLLRSIRDSAANLGINCFIQNTKKLKQPSL